MPPKKKNGFYCFMEELLRAKQSRGESVTMAQMTGIASPIWKTMGPDERAKYVALAKGGGAEDFSSAAPVVDRRKNNQRQFMADKDEEIRQKHDLFKSRENEIKAMTLSWPPGNALIHERFYVISFEYFVKTQENVYFPCEVAAAQFSLREGIVRCFHSFIDPGSVPLGYTGAERSRSEERHHICPFDRFSDSVFNSEDPDDVDKLRRNYANHVDVYSRLLRFFTDEGGKRERNVFTFSEEVVVVEACLDWLYQRARPELGLRENVMPRPLRLSGLVQQMYSHSKSELVTEVPGINSIQLLLTQSVWDYTPKIRCFFHEEKDVKFCTLAQVKRWCYAIFDGMKTESQWYRFQLTANHVPPTSKDVFTVVAMAEPDKSFGISRFEDFGAASANFCRTDQRPEYRDTKVVYQEGSKAEQNEVEPADPWPSLRQSTEPKSPLWVSGANGGVPAPTRPAFGRGVGRGLYQPPNKREEDKVARHGRGRGIYPAP